MTVTEQLQITKKEALKDGRRETTHRRKQLTVSYQTVPEGE